MDMTRLCLHCMREGVVGNACSVCGAHRSLPQAPAYALPMGAILHGQYLVGRALGFGGFGITYIALDLKGGQRVAIKEYIPGALSTRTPGTLAVQYGKAVQDFLYGKQQFLKEARLLYRLRGNPQIIDVQKLFEENGTAYFVMEYLEGCDLKAHLKRRGGSIPLPESQHIFTPVFQALRVIHDKGIIHRDISPDNIFLHGNGSIKLIDFGAAYAALSKKSESVDVILKRGFAPVEQYTRRGKQGPWTDIYALGCTIYCCITGIVPLEATQRQVNDTLKKPSDLGVAISGAQEQALLIAMAVDAKQRYSSAQAFYTALFPANRGKSARELPRQLALRGISGMYEGSTFPLGAQIIALGRDAQRCAIVFPLDAKGISNKHCSLYVDEVTASLILQDHGSSYGTFLRGGKRVAADTAVLLQPGDTFTVGTECFAVVELT